MRTSRRAHRIGDSLHDVDRIDAPPPLLTILGSATFLSAGDRVVRGPVASREAALRSFVLLAETVKANR